MLREAPMPWAKPGKRGITVLWLASRKNIPMLTSATSLVTPLGTVITPTVAAWG